MFLSFGKFFMIVFLLKLICIVLELWSVRYFSHELFYYYSVHWLVNDSKYITNFVVNSILIQFSIWNHSEIYLIGRNLHNLLSNYLYSYLSMYYHLARLWQSSHNISSKLKRTSGRTVVAIAIWAYIEVLV